MLHRDPPSFSRARCRPASTSAVCWTKAQLSASAELSCWRNWEHCPWLKVSGNIYLSRQVLECLGTSLEHAPDPALIPHLACPSATFAVGRWEQSGLSARRRVRAACLAARMLHIYPARCCDGKKNVLQLNLRSYHRREWTILRYCLHLSTPGKKWFILTCKFN